MNDPVTMRRQLRTELRRLRAERDLTQRHVAEQLDWSPSKIIRIEKGVVAIGVTDLQALLRLYTVEDKATIDTLVAMARGSKRLPFNEYRDKLPAATLRFFGYESTASIIRQFEPLVIPGLLQTEEYSRSLLTAVGTPSERIETTWAVRSERQEMFDREDPPEMFFMLDEAAVRRPVGSEKIMRRQIERLIDLNTTYSHVTIRVMPFSAGAYIGLRGPFTYLEFPTDEDPNVLYLEGPLGDNVLRDEEDLTAQYLEAFFALERDALPARDVEKFLPPLE